jgi:hypothetical protein
LTQKILASPSLRVIFLILSTYSLPLSLHDFTACSATTGASSSPTLLFFCQVCFCSNRLLPALANDR